MIWDRPLALFLDVDGTLLDIAQRPEEVAVPEDLGALLQSAWQALEGAMALVSGRAIGDLDGLFAPLRLPAAGQHGTKLLEDRHQKAVVLSGPRVDELRRPPFGQKRHFGLAATNDQIGG